MATDSMESNFVSMKPAIEFIDVLDQYPYNEDLHILFKFNDYSPQEGDRIAIFKLGWSFVKDYVIFEWAPVGSREKQHSVVFNKHMLPKNSSEIYQVCYLSGENELHGASSPFQFSSHETSSRISQNVSVSVAPVVTKPENLLVDDKVDEIKRLREENELLRSSLKALFVQKTEEGCNKNYDKDINDLKEITESLKIALNSQQKDINMLKMKIREGGEEYKKLYLEKVKIEKKLDKFKNKKDEDTKYVAEMVNFDIGELKSIPPFPFSQK